MKKLILILLLSFALLGQTYPSLFSQLGTPLFEEVENFKALKKNELFKKERILIDDYIALSDQAIKHGLALDNKETSDTKVYLKELRQLQKLHDNIEQAYKHKLYKSINDKNSSSFYSLTSTPLPFVIADARLKKSVVQFYQTSKKKKVAYLETLKKDYKLDESSYALLDAMFKTRQKDLQAKTRKHLKAFDADPFRERPVEVVIVKVKEGYDLYLENHAYYDVSIRFKAPKQVNLTSSQKLPFVGSFSAQTRTKFLSFTINDRKKAIALRTLYSTQIGRVNPSYEDTYIYALPYKRGKAYRLTQGFNGKHTHKGQSAYALDFKMNIGTPIHAMREGVVVAVESKNTEHGYSKAFMNKANHIVIQHNDGTMAMYAHLKPNGVKVKLGQEVRKYQCIGLSGNTGFSSGPHLHVHISAIKSFQSGSSSVAFKFKTKKGVISKPVDKTAYLCR
jgi:murein DD-endopeptidase MepM/ murein hydrolase activator NlpD